MTNDYDKIDTEADVVDLLIPYVVFVFLVVFALGFMFGWYLG